MARIIQAGSAALTSSITNITAYTVPAGKDLVIDTIGLVNLGAAPGAANYIYIGSSVALTGAYAVITPLYPGRSHGRTRIVVPQNTVIHVGQSVVAAGTLSAWWMFSGELT
jgi:hypothetical protein